MNPSVATLNPEGQAMTADEATQAAVDAVAKAPCLENWNTLPLDADATVCNSPIGWKHPECAVAALQADRSLLLGLLGLDDEQIADLTAAGYFAYKPWLQAEMGDPS